MAEQSRRNGTSLSLAEGSSVKGYYVKTEKNQGEKKNSQIHTLVSYEDQDVEVSKDKGKATESVHLRKGQRFGVWGCTLLDEQMAQSIPGEYNRIWFEKYVQGKNNDYKDFSVFTDSNIKSIDVSDIADEEPEPERTEERRGRREEPEAAKADAKEDPKKLSKKDLPF